MVMLASLSSGGTGGGEGGLFSGLVVVSEEDRRSDMSASGRSHDPRMRPEWMHAARMSLSSV